MDEFQNNPAGMLLQLLVISAGRGATSVKLLQCPGRSRKALHQISDSTAKLDPWVTKAIQRGVLLQPHLALYLEAIADQRLLELES